MLPQSSPAFLTAAIHGNSERNLAEALETARCRTHGAPHLMPDVARFSSIENLLCQVELLATTACEGDCSATTNTARRLSGWVTSSHRLMRPFHPPRSPPFAYFLAGCSKLYSMTAPANPNISTPSDPSHLSDGSHLSESLWRKKEEALSGSGAVG